MHIAKPLLLADAIINLALGVILVFFPRGLVTLLGIPDADIAFYPSMLGAVLTGIGIALLIGYRRTGGLGLEGAVAINLTGGCVLCLWLLFGDLQLPVRGTLILWSLVAILVGISVAEIHARKRL